MNVGRLHSVSCYPSSPWLLACGGSGNEIAIWDMEGEESIQNRFAGRVSGKANVSDEEKEPDFEAVMAVGGDEATNKALEGMNKSKKKQGKKKKVHKRK
jgi:hypothetical protein